MTNMSEVVSMPPGWCLFPPERFENVTVMDLHAMVTELERDYQVRPPIGVDVLTPLALREWVRENASTAEVWKKHQQRGEQRLYSTFYTETQSGHVIPNTENIAEYLLKSHHIVSYEGGLYVYRDGVYERNNGFIEAQIQDILNKIGFQGRVITVTNEILHRLTYAEPAFDYPFNVDPDAFPVRNGILKIDWKTGEKKRLNHSPEFKNLYKLPVDYNRDADSAEIMRIFEEWVDVNDVEVLFQLPAQCLLQSKNEVYKKAYLFEGEHDAGKTTYYRLLLAFLGSSNVSDVGLDRICHNNFALASMEGKLANFHDELSNVPLRYAGPFKKLTGGINHHIERKNQQGYDGVITAVQAFTCNEPPNVSKAITDDAFWRRWEYIIFPNKFETDASFFSKIATDENLSAFLNKVIEVMIKIKLNGRLIRDSTPDANKERWIAATENLYDFFTKEVQSVKGEYIKISDFYEGYSKYCEEKAVYCDGKSRVSTLLRQLKVFSRQKKIGKKNVWIYQDIRWNETSTYKPSESEKDNDTTIDTFNGNAE